ncbi:SDR family NAD(P)-dependent oxidoreductase [Duganella sp. S19_KUP01_CR8]|uniref:SDR family NAD(P)-dependent oxidoreductase n=1 Tax=Duganella sp. S19_KUP01_CR8 TaxID=3025502 RepID=UPI003FA5E611
MVTGASSGIGLAFSHALAARGANLILVARSRDKLTSLARELEHRHAIRAHALAADLTEAGAASDVHARASALGLAPNILINNAGFATHGHFDALPLARQLDEISLNCRAVVELSHAFLPAMLEQGEGAIINVASTAALQPLPYMAIYGATKAFVLSFSEALWQEYRARGVRVLAVCPGATDTAFFDVVGAEEAGVGARMAAETVVNISLRALDRGQSHVVPGGANRMLGWLPRMLPRQTILQIVSNMLRPRQRLAD